MSQDTDSLAKGIYQGLLDDIARAYESGDFDQYLKFVHVPQMFRLLDGDIVLSNETDLERAFHNIRGHLKALEVTEFVRICNAATFDDSITLIGRHDTYLMHNGTLLQPPIANEARHIWIKGSWKLCSSTASVTKTDWPAVAMRPPGDDMALRDKTISPWGKRDT